MLISSRSKRSEGVPKRLETPLLELTIDQANELSRSGKPETIRSFLLEGSLKADIPGPLPEELQSALADRFYRSVRRKAIIGLLAPLAIPTFGSALVRPLNDVMEWGLNSYHAAGFFGFMILVCALWGNRRSISIEKNFSSMAADVLENQKASSPDAQARFAEIIFLGRNSDAAVRLLVSKTVSEVAQDLLAETIYRYGTQEQARSVLSSGYSGPGTFLLEAMCRD